MLCVKTGAFLTDEKRFSLKDFELHVAEPEEVIEAEIQARLQHARSHGHSDRILDDLAGVNPDTLRKQVEADLQYGPDTGKAEEATRLLGNLLGLKAERPDKKTKGRGPDVVWNGTGEAKAWGLELKTNKDKDGEYDKDEIGQCYQHERWLQLRHDEKYEITIIGRELAVSGKSDPSAKLSVVTLEAMLGLLERTKAVHESVDASAFREDGLYR